MDQEGGSSMVPPLVVEEVGSTMFPTVRKS